MLTLEEFVKSNKYFVVAHRGSSGTAPENTLSAFRLALEAGAKMIEADVQLTLDGHVIAFHDKGLSRTSNGSGLASQTALDEIQKLDAGSWFDGKYANEKVPLLYEIIELIRGKAFINIEVKNINCEYGSDGIKKILDIVSEMDFVEHTLFSSFYYNTLKDIKSLNPRFHTAAIRIPKDKTLPSVIAKTIGCEAFVCSIDEIDDKISEDTINHNLLTGVYSIDSAETLKEMLKYNVSAIVTNYPELIVKELDKLE